MFCRRPRYDPGDISAHPPPIASVMEPDDERVEFYKKLECCYSNKPGKKPYTFHDIDNMIRDILRAKTNR